MAGSHGLQYDREKLCGSDRAMWIPKYDRQIIIERAKSLIGREVARSTNTWANQNKINCLEMAGYAYGWPDNIPRAWEQRHQMIERLIETIGWQWRSGEPQPADLLVFDVRGPHLGIYVSDGVFIHCGAIRITTSTMDRFKRYLKGGLTWAF